MSRPAPSARRNICRQWRWITRWAHPAVSVPLLWTVSGLPVGVHFAGRYGEEATLLALAVELEIAQPWFDRMRAL